MGPMCMSQTLPTLFRNASGYRRQLTLTPAGVIAEETSDDPNLTEVIRAHAREVTGFVTEGMPAMMDGMMGRSSPPHSPASRPGRRAEHHLLRLLEREPRVQAGSPLTLRLPKSSRAGSLSSAQTDARTATVEMT
jgi:hypothetical protein